MQHLRLFLLCALLAFAACQKTDTDTPDQTPPAADDRGDHLLLGNPSSANNDPENFLLRKNEFVLSYNRTRGTANWCAWHLSEAWNGRAERQNDFREDESLPSGWYRVDGNDYRGSGFDRGHLCPSADRDATQEENSTTFLMTNIIPQAPENNREVWRELEEYCRDVMYQGNELYIVAGVYGHGGTGSNGGQTKYLADRNVYIPAQTWKVILILEAGSDDLSRINANTRVIAVDIPNVQAVEGSDWQAFQLSVDELEARTGYDFFSQLSTSLQDVLER